MIGIGVVGYGRWGPNLARCVAASNACNLIALADQSAAALDRARAVHPAIELTTDWRALIARPDIDAVIVATPPRSHFDIAMAALQAGKQVLVEKPITDKSDQGQLLIDEAARRRLILMVDHTFIYTGAVRKIRALIDEGALGQLQYYDATRINLGTFQHDVDVVWDLAAHDLAILDYLFDEKPEAVSAAGGAHVPGYPITDAVVTLFYPSGATARLNLSWMSPVKGRRTLIGGDKRMIVYDDMEPAETKVRLYDTGVDAAPDGGLTYRSGAGEPQAIAADEALTVEIAHFAECIATGRTPLTSGDAGLAVVKALEQASRSMQSRGQPITLTL